MAPTYVCRHPGS